MFTGIFKEKPPKTTADLELLTELGQKTSQSLAELDKQRLAFNEEMIRMLPELIATHERAEEDIREFIKMARRFDLAEVKTAAQSLTTISDATKIYKDLLVFFSEIAKGGVDG